MLEVPLHIVEVPIPGDPLPLRLEVVSSTPVRYDIRATYNGLGRQLSVAPGNVQTTLNRDIGPLFIDNGDGSGGVDPTVFAAASLEVVGVLAALGVSDEEHIPIVVEWDSSVPVSLDYLIGA